MCPVRKNALTIGWLITVAALLVTLYMSEVMLWPVCHLCWYQRICLYPQVILLGMATFKDDRSILPYAGALSVIGLLFALEQYLMQLFPITFEGITLCGTGPSCSTMHIQWLGFITLPLISVSVFATLAFLQLTSDHMRILSASR
jgi:disulfide bond formation protein DsbB